MSEPSAGRPFMPGYGLLGPAEGSGLLPWSWAEERLIASRTYWVVSLWPDGHPHAMPVWGLWHDHAFWFSSSKGSRKARNLTADPRCTVTTEDAAAYVVLEGIAELVSNLETLREMLRQENAKYHTDYTMELMDPAVNSAFRVSPRRAFGLREDDFTGSPTRWTFDGAPAHG
ncbi:MAG TPA: pyridoxamine 5'-phosphate oxidase family protein [Ktedonobacterales bacterium]